MKKIIICFMLLLMCGCSLTNNITDKDIMKYLKSKYGDIDFYFVQRSSCDMFELGYCSYLYSEPGLNDRTFSVTWEDANGKTMRDTYVENLYSEKLGEEYNKKFVGKLNFQYKVNAIIQRSCKECNKSLISFDDYYNLVKNKDVWLYIYPINGLDSSNKNFHLKVNDNIKSEYLSQVKEEVKEYMEEKYDFEKIRKVIKETIELNDMVNIDRVIFYMNDCQEDEYKVSCSFITDIYER